MEYGTDEYWDMLRGFLDTVVQEGSGGPFTDKGMKEDGTDVLYRVVKSLEPFGIRMQIKISPMEDDEDVIEEVSEE